MIAWWKRPNWYRTELLNLLAVIHRDGGHYTAKHGITKSVNDAKDQVPNERQSLRDQLEEANRQVMHWMESCGRQANISRTLQEELNEVNKCWKVDQDYIQELRRRIVVLEAKA